MNENTRQRQDRDKGKKISLVACVCIYILVFDDSLHCNQESWFHFLDRIAVEADLYVLCLRNEFWMFVLILRVDSLFEIMECYSTYMNVFVIYNIMCISVTVSNYIIDTLFRSIERKITATFEKLFPINKFIFNKNYIRYIWRSISKSSLDIQISRHFIRTNTNSFFFFFFSYVFVTFK